jgi:hypothetical protein
MRMPVCRVRRHSVRAGGSWCSRRSARCQLTLNRVTARSCHQANFRAVRSAPIRDQPEGPALAAVRQTGSAWCWSAIARSPSASSAGSGWRQSALVRPTAHRPDCRPDRSPTLSRIAVDPAVIGANDLPANSVDPCCLLGIDALPALPSVGASAAVVRPRWLGFFSVFRCRLSPTFLTFPCFSPCCLLTYRINLRYIGDLNHIPLD